MAGTTRFHLDNSNACVAGTQAGFPRIINGDTINYTTPPARVEDVNAGAMEQIFTRDKYSPWVIPAGQANSGADTKVDIDFGGDFVFAGLANFGVSTQAFPHTCAILTRTDAQGYSSADAGWSAPGTMDCSNDGGSIFPATQVARYVRLTYQFSQNATAPWYIGKLNAMRNTFQDLLQNSAYGYTEGIIHPVSRTRTLANRPVRVFLGNPGKRFVFPFRSVPTTVKTKLLTVAREQRPFLYLDSSDLIYEVVPIDDTFDARLVFNGLWDIDWQLETT